MREFSAKGICLRTNDIGDSDKLCNIYLLGIGKRCIKFKSVKKAKGKLAFAASPLCLGEYNIIEKGGYHTCIGCDLISSFMPIWSDIDKYFSALSALELLDKFSNDDQLVDDLAYITIDYITRIAAGKYFIGDYLEFLYRFYVVAGYGISTDQCAICGTTLTTTKYYSYSQSGFICANCHAENLVIGGDVYDIIIDLSQGVNIKDKGYSSVNIYLSCELILCQIKSSCNVNLTAGSACLNNLKAICL